MHQLTVHPSDSAEGHAQNTLVARHMLGLDEMQWRAWSGESRDLWLRRARAALDALTAAAPEIPPQARKEGTNV